MLRRSCFLTSLLLETVAVVVAAGGFRAAASAQDPAPADADAVVEAADGAEQEGEKEAEKGEGDPDDKVFGGADVFFEKLKHGGTTVIVQILLSIFGLSVVLERLYSLRRSRLVPDRLLRQVDELWDKAEYSEIERICRKNGSALGNVLVGIVKHRADDFHTVSTIAGDIASREMRRHLGRLFPVVIVATLEPLLGLLGTILGMIGAFDTVAAVGSMGDASLLADDIAKALVTTAVGLSIAIPALFLYYFLRNRTLSLSSTLEEEVSDRISRWLLLDKNKSASTSKEAPTNAS